LGFGFAIAGYAKDENQVAPLANVIQLPMLLLSGIFFPREGFPPWLYKVTNYFPLTYLSDGMRHIANEGLHLSQISNDLLGLVVWTFVIFIVAIKMFRWE
jgi:ABC-2 type transport system permease protein